MVIFHSYVSLPEGTLWSFVSELEKLENGTNRNSGFTELKDGDFPVRKV
jgi:hypothetical protein